MKRWIQKTIVFATMFSPFAAWGDIIGPWPWRPPATYHGFLYSHGYYRSGNLETALTGIVCVGLPLFAGVLLLSWIVRHRRSRPATRRTAINLLVAAILICIVCGYGAVLRKQVLDDFSLMFGGEPPNYRDAEWEDTLKHQTEYDQMCIEYYDTHEPIRIYHASDRRWERDHVPSIRDGAPESVTNAYLRFRAKMHVESASPEELGIGTVE